VQGKPAAGATVTLYPATPGGEKPRAFPSAVVQPDGSFRVTTFSAYDGAPPGDYGVAVTWSDEVRSDGDALSTPDRLQGRYADPATSGLKAMIKPGKNELKRFELN